MLSGNLKYLVSKALREASTPSEYSAAKLLAEGCCGADQLSLVDEFILAAKRTGVRK